MNIMGKSFSKTFRSLFLIAAFVPTAIFGVTGASASDNKAPDDELAAAYAMHKKPQVPAAYKEYVKTLTAPTFFLEMKAQAQAQVPRTISRDQASQDVELIKYIFENGYSGKEYWEQNGVDFADMYKKLAECAGRDETVKVADLEAIMVESLEKVIDGHLSIRGTRDYKFWKHKDAYFADVVVEKQGDSYVVLRSSCDKIPVGSVYCDNVKNLFRTLSAQGKEQYLLGTLSVKYVPSLKLKFNSAAIDVPLHSCKIGRINYADSAVFSSREVDGVPVVRVANFDAKNHENLVKYSEFGKTLRDREYFILDICDNYGGSSRYSDFFFRNLNTVACWMMFGGELYSPATRQSWANEDLASAPPFLQELIKEARKEVEKLRKKPVRSWLLGDGGHLDQEKGDYKGVSAILMNRGVCSSGEGTIAFSKSVPKNFLIGENSAGVGTFGEVLVYSLPNSKIAFYVPSKLFLSPDLKEGRGYLPDYWLDSSDPVTQVVKWLKNPAEYQFEPAQQPVLHDVDCEEFVDGCPKYFTKTVGAQFSPTPANVFEQDTKIFREGKSSLKITNDAATRAFYSVKQEMREGYSKVTATYSLKGDGIRVEGDQFDNCYAGFIYKDASGKTQFYVRSYSGTFDWKDETIVLDVEKLHAREIKFSVFNSMSGSLWIDGVKFRAQ